MKLKVKNYNMILTEKQQKYQHYHLEKFVNMNILQVKKYCLLIEQTNFAQFTLGKASEKQTEKQISALKSLHLSTKKDELKQIEGIFHKI